MHTLSDQELVARYLKSGDKRFFSQLYSRHYCRVYRKCLFYTNNSSDSEDFAQDIFIRLTRKLRAYKGEAKFTTWLHAITVNYCIDQLRRRQQQQQHWNTYLIEHAGASDAGNDAEEMRYRGVEYVLKQLPAHQLDLLLTKYKEGTQISEIAHQRDLTASAVKMRIKRARDRARRLYDTYRMRED